MEIDGIPSIPPIESVSPVQEVDARLTQRAAESPSEATIWGAAESSTAQPRWRKAFARSVNEAAATYTETDLAAVDSAAAEARNEETAINDASTAGTKQSVEGQAGQEQAGQEQPGEEYVVTAPVLHGRDVRGPGIELSKVVPEPILDTVA